MSCAAGLSWVVAFVWRSGLLRRPPPARCLMASAQQEVAAVEQLKSEAFKDLRGGHFDRTNDLLAQAASLSHDPRVEQMAAWTKHFETQREEFAAERHKQYEKAVEDVKKLQS